MFETLVNKIASILEANELISICYKYEAEELSGDPAVVIIPSANSSDYNTLEENIRIYAFTVRIYVKRNSPRQPEDADRILRGLTDSIINNFDKDYTFSGMTVPNGYTYINTFAAPSSWGYAGREDEYRVATVDLSCRVSVDINNI